MLLDTRNPPGAPLDLALPYKLFIHELFKEALFEEAVDVEDEVD